MAGPQWIVPYTPQGWIPPTTREGLAQINLSEEWLLEYTLSKYAFVQHCLRHNRADWLEGELAGDMGDYFFPPTDDPAAELPQPEFERRLAFITHAVLDLYRRLEPLLQDPDRYLGPGHFSHFTYRPFDHDSILVDVEAMDPN